MNHWFVAIQLGWPYLTGMCLAVSVLLTLRAYVFFWMADQKPRELSHSTEKAALVVTGQGEFHNELRPVEFAYLMRGGDITHALSVLVIDLIQRSIKSQTASEVLPLADYEVKMWTIVKDSVRNWAAEKKDAILIESFKRDPVAYVRRWSGIYAFLRKNLKPFVTGVTKDPRNLRKYFSVGGVIRLLADFSTAGYQQTFARELKESLLQRGLLVTDERKHTAAIFCYVLAGIGTGAAAVFATLVMHNFMFFVFASLIALAARAILFIKQLIPYYVDVLELISHIRRGGIRLQILKTVASFLNNSFYVVSVLIFLVGTGLLALFMHFYSQTSTTTTYLCTVALAIAMLACWDVALSGWRISIEEFATARGKKLFQNTRSKIRSLSPLEEFKTVLQSTEYDETFSDLVGLYGIETLLFLA